MCPDHNNIQLLIAHKEQELKTLKEEWKKASHHPADTDYEYLALLYPIIDGLEREISRFRELAANEYAGELYFEPHIRQLLKGECQRLEIHIESSPRSYRNFKGPVIVFDRMKQKYAIAARLLLSDELQYAYFNEGNFDQLSRLGWKREGKQAFRLKYFVRNEEDLILFHRLIACTFVEPLSYLIQATEHQHIVVIPSPDL